MFIEPAKSLDQGNVNVAPNESGTPINLAEVREAARARLLRYLPSVNSTIYKITGGSSISEDLKQELALKILLIKRPEEIESPAAFLRKVVMRTHLDHLRNDKRRKCRETDFSSESTQHELSPSPRRAIGLDANLNRQEYSLLLVKAFEDLSTRDKQAVLLRLAGASLREAAQVLQVDEVSAGVRLSRALANIRETLSPYAFLINEREDARRAFDVLLSSDPSSPNKARVRSRSKRSVDIDSLATNATKTRKRIRRWNIALESKARLISATYNRPALRKNKSHDERTLRNELSDTLDYIRKCKPHLVPTRIVDTCVHLLRRDKTRWVLFTLRAFQVNRSESALELMKLKRESIVNLTGFEPKELIIRVSRLNIAQQDKSKIKSLLRTGI